MVSPLLKSRVTGQPVVGAQIALRNPDGQFDGSVAITLDVHWFDYLLHNHPIPKDAVEMVFDRSGAILASNDRVVAQALAAAVVKAGMPDSIAMNARTVPAGTGISRSRPCAAKICSSPMPH